MALTPRQAQVLDWIKILTETGDGIAPTLQELAEKLSTSKVTTFEHVRALVRKGHLRHCHYRARSLVVIDPNDAVEELVTLVRGNLSRLSPESKVRAMKIIERIAG